jgi:hypothetical protein
MLTFHELITIGSQLGGIVENSSCRLRRGLLQRRFPLPSNSGDFPQGSQGMRGLQADGLRSGKVSWSLGITPWEENVC